MPCAQFLHILSPWHFYIEGILKGKEVVKLIEAMERLTPLLVAVVTAVTPIVLAIASNGKKDRAQQKENSDKLNGSIDALKSSVDRMDNRICTLEEHADEHYRRLLVMEIMEENLPVEERLKAGEKYVAKGWNGPVKARYELLLEEYKQMQREEFV